MKDTNNSNNINTLNLSPRIHSFTSKNGKPCLRLLIYDTQQNLIYSSLAVLENSRYGPYQFANFFSTSNTSQNVK